MKQAMAVALWSVLLAAPACAETPTDRGRYLVESLAACGNCHTQHSQDGPQMDKYLAGGECIKHKGFDAISSNITPDPETGVGRWSDAELFRAIREGRRRDGSLIGPAMPFPSYRALANDDVKAIITYLRGVPPVRNAVAEKAQYDFTLPDSWGPPVGHIEAPPKDDKVAYGAYLAGPVAGCTVCHTQQMDAEYGVGAGGAASYGPSGISVAANIIPAGIGDWTNIEIERAIRNGVARDGHQLLPPMPSGHYKNMSKEDMTALIAYLRSLPSIE
jgi:mono/diheme cytochrome c family protein